MLYDIQDPVVMVSHFSVSTKIKKKIGKNDNPLCIYYVYDK